MLDPSSTTIFIFSAVYGLIAWCALKFDTLFSGFV